MLKYIAVIKDSFREAIASRVLWLLLAGISLFLLVVAPLSYREVVTTGLTQHDVRKPDDFLVMLRQVGPREEKTPVHQLWLGLSEKTRTRLRNVKIQGKDQEPGNPFEFLSLLKVVPTELGQQLEKLDFYDPEVFQGVAIVSRESRELLKRRGVHSSAKPRTKQGTEQDKDVGEPLSEIEVRRLNRLMLEAALPDYIRVSDPTSTQFVYAWMDAMSPQPISGHQVRDAIKSSAATVLNLFVGAVGVFVAILVTAPVIPQMFDAGSLHLLLSKPISRWLLFLSKFLGGCAFILIAAVYLIGGLWLVIGVRFGVWEPRLLFSIPIYLFVFAIYYSVSSLAAVVWRSPIVSIAVSILFWLACFVIGTTKVGLENMVLNKERFVRVFFAGDTLFGIDEFGWGYAWQPDRRAWQDQFVLPDQRQSRTIMLVAPAVPRAFRATGHVYDAAHDRLLAAIPAFPPSTVHFAVGQRDNHWEPVTRISAPTGFAGMFVEPTGKILVASSLGLSRLTGDPLAEREPVKLFGMSLPLPRGGPFQNVNPDPAVLITQPADIAVDPVSGAVLIYTRGMLHLLEPVRNRFQAKAEARLDGKERQAAVVALGGGNALVGRDDGRLQVYDPQTLTVRRDFRPERRDPPRFIDVSPDGRHFAVVFHTGRLWLYDSQSGELTCPNVTGQGDISAANFAADGRLLVVDRLQRVSQYQLSPWQLEQRYSPSLGPLLAGYRYVLAPLYAVFPKPGELDKTFQYLLSGKTTEQASDEEGDEDLTSAQWNIDPWVPLWSSAAFMVVVLLAACVYIEFQDF